MWRVESRAVCVRTGSIVHTSPRLATDLIQVTGSNIPVLCAWLTTGFVPT